MNLKYDNVIIDMDGTLVDTFEGISRCLNLALKKMNKPSLPSLSVRKFLGPALYNSFINIAGFSHDEAELAVKLFREEYVDKGIYECKIYDGFPEVLLILNSAGVKLSIGSAKPYSSVIKLLQHFNIDGMFETVVGAEPNVKDSSKLAIVGKAKIGERPLMVGDRIFDIQAAKQLQIDCAAALYGYSSDGEFDSCPPTWFISSPKDLIDLVLI